MKFMRTTAQEIAEQIERARQCLEEPPPNEATTCHWVIYPLLQAMGYENRDILIQDAAAPGQFPDYTITASPHETWYLEAKSWKNQLLDQNANQALDYANRNGRRWVVLSNGRGWRLYDNQIQGLASDKLVAVSTIEAPAGLEALLAVLSKDTMAAEKMDLFARRARLARVFIEQVREPRSRLIKSICSALRAEPGLHGLTGEDVTWLLRTHSTTVATEDKGAVARPSAAETDPSKAVKATTPGRSGKTPGEAGPTLDLSRGRTELENTAQGKKPEDLTLPDGTTRPVSSWKALTVAAVEWLLENGEIPPLPFRARRRGSSYFLNTSPRHESKDMLRSYKFAVGHRNLYMDTDLSAVDLLDALRALVIELKQRPDAFRITVRE
ncbi:MAG: hypothetical protein LC772_05485 [Chloroflexi bacterium]|nr:hypothetical protein [Chloroflexota bacterium]